MEFIVVLVMVMVGWLGGAGYQEKENQAQCEKFKKVELNKTLYDCKVPKKR
jgi:hypothetical protein